MSSSDDEKKEEEEEEEEEYDDDDDDDDDDELDDKIIDLKQQLKTVLEKKAKKETTHKHLTSHDKLILGISKGL